MRGLVSTIYVRPQCVKSRLFNPVQLKLKLNVRLFNSVQLNR